MRAAVLGRFQREQHRQQRLVRRLQLDGDGTMVALQPPPGRRGARKNVRLQREPARVRGEAAGEVHDRRRVRAPRERRERRLDGRDVIELERGQPARAQEGARIDVNLRAANDALVVGQPLRERPAAVEASPVEREVANPRPALLDHPHLQVGRMAGDQAAKFRRKKRAGEVRRGIDHRLPAVPLVHPDRGRWAGFDAHLSINQARRPI